MADSVDTDYRPGQYGLVLTRKLGEQIQIGEWITVTVVSMGLGRVKLGVKAPNEMTILRPEKHLPE